jgi:hypothetical protein
LASGKEHFEGETIRQFTSVAEYDSQCHIYVKHTVGKGSVCSDAVLVFDANGNLVTSWGDEFKGGAHGLHLAREGSEEFLYLTDPFLRWPRSDGVNSCHDLH